MLTPCLWLLVDVPFRLPALYVWGLCALFSVVAVLLRTRWCQLEREVGRCAGDMATPLCASQDRACMYVQSKLAVVTQPLLCVCVCMCLP